MQRSVVNFSEKMENFPNSNSANGLLNNHNVPVTANHSYRNGILDEKSLLQKELEQERSMRKQLEQHILDLNQKLHTQKLVEQSYEDLAQKYKALINQVHQMSLIIERYKSIVKQMEQDKRMVMAENESLKVQENIAHDKTMLYNILMERSKKLEEENSSLVLENETHQRQYEKCIEDISKQVVQALLTQKALQEQCTQLQERIVDLERENAEHLRGANSNRQASSDSRLAGSTPHGRRGNAASPSADSVRSMPAQHGCWKQDSVTSLEVAQFTAEQGQFEGVEEMSSPPVWLERENAERTVCIETEFPATEGSPKVRRRNVDRHPSNVSLDSAYHSRTGFFRTNKSDVRCNRSASAEALRDIRVGPVKDSAALVSATSNAVHTVSGTSTVSSNKTNSAVLSNSSPAASSAQGTLSSQKTQLSASQQPKLEASSIQCLPQELSRGASSEIATSNMNLDFKATLGDPFADETDDILSKHKSLIVGSTEDIFSAMACELATHIQQNAIEEESCDFVPAPPPRPRSRCQSEATLVSSHNHRSMPDSNAFIPPPLPPKQYKGSRRPYKPLPAEPMEDGDTSGDRTDSDSIKLEINQLTSKIARLGDSFSHT